MTNFICMTQMNNIRWSFYLSYQKICVFGKRQRGKEEAMRLLLVCMHSFNKFISPNTYLEIHSFRDCCSGQTKNKTKVAFFMYMCQSTHIQSWTHTFLESGHWFLTNGTDFGQIERAKNKNVSIFTADDWKIVIRLFRSLTFRKMKSSS